MNLSDSRVYIILNTRGGYFFNVGGEYKFDAFHFEEYVTRNFGIKF